MSWQAIVIYLVVAGIGFPAAFRNPTAAALVVAWLAGEIIVELLGNSLPLGFYFAADMTVISLIYAKAIHRAGPRTYRSIGRQLSCMVTELTPWDRAIVAIFMLGMWPAYVVGFDPWSKWMLLWGLSITQFILAGAEAASSLRHDVVTEARSEPQDSGFAMAGFRGYG